MKDIKSKILGRKVLSFILTVTLLVGLMPGNILTVSAEGTDTVISDELIVESVSSNDASATTECTCGTDDPAFHATNCPAYIAPENPQCFCAEKCTDDTLNVWCDVCGMQGVSACQGEDTAVVYTDVVASITNGETVTNYATFDEALANWTDGTTLTLLADVTLTECIKTYEKGLILDLNGHKIECSDNWTIWIDGASGSELTIRDSQDDGHINGVVYAVAGGSKLCLESGTVETVAANGDFTMTGGRIISEDGSGLSVNSEVDVVISGGEIYGSTYGVWITIGNVIISGDTKITGAGQYAIRSSSSDEVVISGTPTISGGTGEFYLNSKITLNTQPANGKVWRVKINTEEITDGIFAVPGEGIALDASKFASAMDGYDVKQNAKGELLLCNHQTAYAAVSNEDGSTHKMLCCCRETTVEASVACSGFGATCQTKAVCAACGQSYGETNPDVHTFNDDGKCVCGAERDAATTVDLSSLTATYVISDSGEYIFTGTGSYGIKVESGNPKIVLNNVNISLTDGDYYENNPINGIHIATTGGTTEILVLGESSITAKAGAGIFVAEGGTVKITGSSREDILIATGASGCSGIGGYVYYTNGSVNCGNIEISNVTVKAFGSVSSMGDRTPAIGGAGNGNCGYITIDNADVYAEGYINPYGYEGSSAIGTGVGWGNREGGTIGEISIINDSKVYVTRGNYCDYIGCCGHENAPADGVVTATAKSSTIYCYDSTDTTEPVQTLKYGALGDLLKEDGTCEGEHTGIICDNCGYCSCTHEGVEPTYALTEDGSRHTATWSCCGYEVTEEHSWNCEPDEANTNMMTFSCTIDGCTKGGTITVTGPEGAIYDVNNHTATVTVETKENEELIETPVITYDSLTEGVELVDGKPVNAGTYTANLTVGGVTASVEFTIAPKTLEIGCVTARDRAFDGTNKVEVSEVIISGILNTDNVSVSATATIDSINVGEYSTVDLSGITLTGDAASNYSIVASAEDVDLVPTVTISKAAAPTLPRGSKEYVYNQSYEGELVSITGVPTDCGEVEYVLLSVSGDMLENILVDASNGKITYDVKALDSYTEDLQGTIDVNVVMENYETAFYTLTITRRDKYAVTVKDGMSVSLETNELIYGQRLGELAFNEVTFVGEAGEEVTGTLKWENSNEVPVVATDKASWRFIPDSDVYKEVVGTLDITVHRAPLMVEAVPVVVDRVYNPSVTLADVALSGGTVKDEYGHTIEGTWSWEDSGTVPTVGNAGYEAVFTPVDVNYETVTGTITVTVAKATPVIGIVSVLDAELENTTDISMVVLKRTDESMAGTLELAAEALLYGAHRYVWKFTPQDLNNYGVLTGSVAIEVKDTIAPVASYKIGTGDWKSFGTSTTYETFSKEELSVEIKAEDSGSGIAYKQYYISDVEITNTANIQWSDYTDTLNINATGKYYIYVKVTDNYGNVVIQNSEGIVVYEESVITPTSFSREYGEENDLSVNITTNGNTFAKLTDGSGNEIATENYSVAGSTLTINGEYLSDLDVGEYTYKICMNPQGVENTEETLTYSFVVKVTAKELTVTGATAASRAYIANDETVNITGITLSGKQGTDDVSVEITGLKGTLSSANAGTYTSVTLPTLTLTGDDAENYVLVQPTSAVATNVTINKLNPTITVGATEYYKTFGDADFTLDITDDNPEANVTYSSNDENVVTVSNGTVTIKGAGSTTITVSMGASTNYNAAVDKTITVNVAKATYSVDTINKSYLYARSNADTINLAELLPEDCGTVNYASVTSNGALSFISEPKVTNGILAYTLESGAANDTGIIVVDVETQNYVDITITVNVTLIDQIPVSVDGEVELNSNILTYGETLSGLTFKSVDFVDNAGNAVAGTLAWKEPSATPNAGTTSATWVFTPNNAEYASVEGTVAITVNKATPNVTGVPTVADRVYNPSVVLADSDLTGGTVKGVGGNSLAGSWSWQSTNVVPVVNNSGYIAVFTPTDSTNYETVTRTITVNVTKATPYVATKPTASVLIYGQTLNQSVLSNGVIHYSETDSTVVAGSFAWEAGTVKPAVSDSATTLYNVLFTPDDSDNYKEVTVKLTVSVSKAEATSLNNANKTYVYAESKNGESVSIEGLPEDCGSVSYEISSISDTNNMLENVSVDATGKLTYDVKSLNAYSNGLSATVTVTVSMQNYEDLTYTLTVVRTDKLVQNISAENISLTFGDDDTDIVVTGNKTELSYRVVDDSNENGDVVTVDSTGKVHIVNSGTATVEIKAEGSSSYAEAICEIQVTVAKRTVNVPAKDDTVYTYTGLPQTYSIASSPFYTIENTTQTNAGTYDVAVSLISDNYQWSAVLPEYKFVIKPAQVTITAESHTVKQGDELPAFTYITTGLVNGENLPITVSVTCSATNSETVGTYDIVVSGPANEGNYTYTYKKGTLEVLAEDNAPFIMGDDGKMGWDAISDAIDNAGASENIKVDMNGATVVPGDIIEEARDKGITISFVLDNGLTWTIDGSTVTDGDISNINFDTTVEDENNPLNNIPVDVINGVTGEKATIEVNLTYSGNFGFTAGLKANLGSDNAGYYANLYYYNPTTGKLEYVCADMIAANGDSELTFTHASDYLIVIDDEDLGKVKEDTNTNTNTGNNTNTNTGNNTNTNTGNNTNTNTGNNNTDNNSATTTPAATNGTVSNNTKVVSPDTGDEGAFWIWMLVLASLLGMAGAIGTKRVSGKKN